MSCFQNNTHPEAVSGGRSAGECWRPQLRRSGKVWLCSAQVRVCSRHARASALTPRPRAPDWPRGAALPVPLRRLLADRAHAARPPAGRPRGRRRARTTHPDTSVGISDAAEIERKRRAAGPGAGGGGQALAGDTSPQRRGAALSGARLGLETPPRTHTHRLPLRGRSRRTATRHVVLCCKTVRKPRARPPATLGREPP